MSDLTDKPSFTVIAGPNGSGKSSLIDILRLLSIDLPNYHNADDLVRLGIADAEISNLDAQIAVRKARDNAIRAGDSFCYETVMSHVSHIKAMRAARDAGFFVRLIFVTTDNPQINVDRVANRVAKGGHAVPKDKILSRYDRVMHSNLFPAIDASDEAIIFDASHDGSGSALLVAHIIGLFVKTYNSGNLDWPSRCILDPIKRSGRYVLNPDIAI